jgi:hypothetical protein
MSGPQCWVRDLPALPKGRLSFVEIIRALGGPLLHRQFRAQEYPSGLWPSARSAAPAESQGGNAGADQCQ